MIKLLDILKEVRIVQPIRNNLAELKSLESQIESTSDKKLKQELGIKCAELVLPIWEKYHPDDKRPENAIKAAKQYLADPTEENRVAVVATANAAYYVATTPIDAAWADVNDGIDIDYVDIDINIDYAAYAAYNAAANIAYNYDAYDFAYNATANNAIKATKLEFKLDEIKVNIPQVGEYQIRFWEWHYNFKDVKINGSLEHVKKETEKALIEANNYRNSSYWAQINKKDKDGKYQEILRASISENNQVLFYKPGENINEIKINLPKKYYAYYETMREPIYREQLYGPYEQVLEKIKKKLKELVKIHEVTMWVFITDDINKKTSKEFMVLGRPSDEPTKTLNDDEFNILNPF